MAGAQLFLLPDAFGPRGKVGDGFLDSIGPVASDDDDTGGRQAARRGQGMRDQRHAAQLVQRFGQIGIHPRALARGQHDHCDWPLLAPVRIIHAAVPSFCARFYI